MTLQIKFQDGDNLGRKFEFGVKRFGERAFRASQDTARRVADEIISEGRQDMASAGNFVSARWQEGLKAKISYKSRSDINIRVTHDVKYWTVFEFGAVIYGKPLLWIPLSFADDAKGVRARDYPAPLFRVDRASGAPLLLTPGGGPKYFGKEYVSIPPKFHLRQIAARISRKMGQYYREAFKNGGK